MPQAIFGAMGAATLSTSTTYFGPLVGQLNANSVTTTEANSQTLARSEWNLSTLFVRWDTNGLSAASTVQTRINSAPGNLNVSIPASASGTVTDSTNTDTLSSGDTGGYTYVMGAGGTSCIIRVVAAIVKDFGAFTAASTQKFVGQVIPFATIPNGLVRNMTISGNSSVNSTEANAQWTARIALTATNLKGHVSANNLTASSTLRFRVGAANGNQSVSISNGATGNFEDTTNNDVVATTSTINYQLTTGGTSSSSMTVDNIQALYAAGAFQVGFILLSGDFSNAFAANGNRFDPVDGTSFQGTETTAQYTAGIAGKIQNLFVRVTPNTLTGASTYRSRKNTADGNLVVNISNGATGTFEDTTNVDMIVSTDVINRAISNASTSTGSVSFINRGSIFTPAYNPQPTDVVRVFDGRLRKQIFNILNTSAVLIADSVTKTATKSLREILRIRDLLAPRNKIRFIQSATNSGSGTSMTVTLPNAPTKGNGIILTIGIDSALLQTVSSITSAGATWVQAVASINGVVDNEIWYAPDLQEAPGATITINFTGVTLETHATAREYSGLEDINMLDKVIDNSGSSTNPDTGTTATTTVANELWVGSTTTLSVSNQSAPTNSFILIDGVTGTLISNAYLEKFAVAVGQAHSGTTADNAAWAGCAATFKAPTIFEVVITDILRIVDAIRTAPKAILRMFENVRINDFLSKRALSKTFKDAMRIVDSAAKTATKRLIDTVRIRDYVRRAFPRTFTDTVRINDATRRTTTKALQAIVRIRDYLSNRTLTKTFSDTLRVTDRTVKTVSKTLLDIVRIVDRATATLVSGVKQIIVTDTLRVVDFVRRTVTKPLADPLRIADYLASRTIIKRLTDMVRIVDSMRTTPKAIIRAFDTIRINDYITKRTRKVVSDALRIRDYLARRAFAKMFTDPIRIADYARRTTTKLLRDIVRIQDYLAKRIFTKAIMEIVRIRDFTVKAISKRIVDPVSIRERLSATHIFNVLLNEALRIKDFAVKTVAKAITDMVRIRETLLSTKSKLLLITDALRISERVTKTVTKPFMDAVRIVESIIVNRVGHIFTIIITDVVQLIGLPIGSIVVLIKQGAGKVRRGIRSIGAALEIALHPSEPQKDSVGQADS